ncbi:MAG: hypothetical protein GY953_54925, partial [bacterium]|nr:hypothetical protein [bacterium]
METVTDVFVDESGFIWLTGITWSNTPEDGTPNFPTNGPPLQDVALDFPNAFVTKLDPFTADGVGILFSGFFGGGNRDEPAGIAVHTNGHVFVGGTTWSNDFPTTGGAFQTATTGGDTEAFLIEFDLSRDGAALVYGTFFGGDEEELCTAMELDSLGRAYLVGATSTETGFPISSNPLQSALRGTGDGFFAILDSTRNGGEAVTYSTLIGGTAGEVVNHVAIVDEGSVYLTGVTMSGDFPVAGNPYRNTAPATGSGDVFVTRLEWFRTGFDQLAYSTYVGGTDLDQAEAVVVEESGKVHVAGFTISDDFPTTAAAVQSSRAGDADIFVFTLDPSKPGGESLLFSTYIGGANGDAPVGMAADSAGGLVLAGYTLSVAFPVLGDTLQSSHAGVFDAFFLRMDPTQPSGSVLTCSSYLGAPGLDTPRALTVDGLDNVYIGGDTSSFQFPIAGPAFQSTKPGTFSAFVSKIGPCQQPPASGSGSEVTRGAGSRVGRQSYGRGR